MSTGLSAATIGICLVAALWSIVLAALNRAVDVVFLGVVAVVELLVVAQAVVAVVLVVSGDRPASTATFLGYALGAIVIAPVGVLWSLAERSRSSTLVITVACLALAVMTVRMLQMWSGVSV